MAKKNDLPGETSLAQEQPETKAEAQATDNVKQIMTGEPVTQHENTLLPLHELAHRHRVPTWQQAALHQLMGWAEGKNVSDGAYQAGLERLSGRRMGGQ